MKILYVTDLHGDKKKYRKILDVAIEKEIKVIVNGGDMLPKQCDRHSEQSFFINGFLDEYFEELKKQDITYLAMLGNDDLLAADEMFDNLCDRFENVCNIAGRKFSVNGYEFIGMNYILDHPFGCKDRVVTETHYIPQRQLSPVAGISNAVDYDRIYNWLEYSRTELPHMCDVLKKLPLPDDRQKAVYVMHMPPAGLRLGQLRYQDLDIGSVDIYEFLKEKQSLLSLHGHIHESPDTEKGKWINQIHQTTCIQTGQTELNDKYIIDEETFELVQKFISVKKRPNKTGRPNMFVGLVKCPDCGRNMAFSNPNGREPRFRCRTYARNSNLCTTHAISYDALVKIVMDDIQKHIKNMETLGDQFIEEMRVLSESGGGKKIKQFKQELELAEKRIAEIDSIIMKLFEQNVAGKISDGRFEKMSVTYENEQRELEERRKALKEKIEAEDYKTKNTNQFLETIRKYENVTELNRSMLVELIDSIYVYQAEGTGKERTQKVEINYRFLCESQCGIA